MKEIKINRFDLGMSDDVRDLSNGYFYYIENMGVGDDTNQITQVGDITTTSSTRGILKLEYVIGTGIFGLGKDGSSKYCIQKYSGGSWNAYSPASTASYDTIANPFFVYYQGYIYFMNGTNIGRYTLADNTTTGNWASVGTINMLGGVEWQGNLYGWIGKDIYKVTTAGVVTNMITVPTDQSIVELIPYGNLLAIICTGTVESNMYLWDGVTTTSFYDIVKIGVGNVIGGTLLNGEINVVIGEYGSAKVFRIKRYFGDRFRTAYYYAGRANNSGTINTYIISRIKEYKGYIYFIGSVTRPNSTDTKASVMFRYGKKIETEPESFCVYKNLNFASSTLSGYNQSINDFVFYEGSINATSYVPLFVILRDTSSAISELASADGVYTQPGIIETGKYTGGDGSANKTLKAVAAQYAGLTGSGVLGLYKNDVETGWTAIFQDTTANSQSHEAVNVESSGANLPTAKELAFRLVLNGGNTITRLKFKYEELNNLYG